jgi:hypothetical protein
MASCSARLTGLTGLAGLLVVASSAVLLALPAGAAVAPPAAVPSATAGNPATLNAGDGVSPSAIAATAAGQCASAAYKAGFPYNRDVAGYPSIVVAVAIGLAESSCNPAASNSNGATSGCPDGSTDRGLWQINNCYQPQVSDACAYNSMCNAIGAYQISDQGTSYTPWATYNSGVYLNYISDAETAVSGLTVTLFNQNTDRCLGADSADTANGAPVFQWACDASNTYEQWHIEVVDDNLQVLQNVGTGTCLDGDGSDSGNGTLVFQWSCGSDGSAYEQWPLSGSDSLSDYANATLYNWGDKTCLANDSADVGNGGTIFQWGCNSSNSWELWS